MLKFLKWFFGLFSKYVNSFERRVDKFFTHIKSTDHLSDIREDLLKLMQGNLIVLNVWLEKKFKGYTYLSKKVRRRMYENSDLIKSEFLKFYGEFSLDNESIRKDLNSKGLLYPNGDDEKIKYIACIQEFLSPGKYYEYIQTSSFGKLLNDPSKEKLQGDCNQIVTLYIYLYSLKYSISDLNIKLLPEHVCLHFRGIDIEATNGTFAKHTESRDVLPVTEIISTNLLDLTDFREEVQEISPQMIVKSAQLAYAISSLKSFVAKNLDIAYHNLGVNALNANNFESAIFYLEKIEDKSLLLNAYHNGAIYYMNNGNFQKAKYYAEKSGNKEIVKTVTHTECVKEYNELLKKVSGVKTLDDAKRHKYVYQKMLDLAGKMGDSKLEASARETLEKI